MTTEKELILKSIEAKIDIITKLTEEIMNDIWNAAIEAAAEIANQCGDYNPASYYVEDIRKLKK
jgi:hypothetical protein